MAKNNPFRFSTKYDDDESDLVYYGYRYYKPSTGTWPNRDPLGEMAFLSGQSKGKTGQLQEFLKQEATLPGYLFARNNSVQVIDGFGLQTLSVGHCEVIVFYGHGVQGQPYQFDWPRPCGAATFIGCYDAETDGNIPSISQIPGVPTTDGEMQSTELDTYFSQAWKAAEVKALKMCKICRCACPVITIKTVQVPGSPLDTAWLPNETANHQDEQFKCQ